MELLGGSCFAVAGAGESHGPGITTIVSGCPAGLRLSRSDLQQQLDRRRPGSSKLGTPRREGDKVVILSGLYDDDHDTLLGSAEVSTRVDDDETRVAGYETGWTTGEPIAAIVLSAAKRSADYDQFLGATGDVRPGHADLVKYHKSMGFTDPRGGGRTSFRSMISDVIGGTVARRFLAERFGTFFLSAICQVGELRAEKSLSDLVASSDDPHDLRSLQQRLCEAELPATDDGFAEEASRLITQTRKEGDSLGAMLEIVGVHVPALAGEPLYNSLKMRLMGSLGGLNAVQSCEMGSGQASVSRHGSEHNDPIRQDGYATNHHGGLLGGITTGSPLVFRVGFKPTSTITARQPSIRKNFEEIDFQLGKGRHDPCVGVRAGVALESRMAIEVMDAVLAHQSGRVDPDAFRLFGDGEQA
ncbi:MAG: chorismate synthase [Gemmatimonadetes bacterium]|nr:chorismate synthase [Gemmatimonadota bacterium]MBT7863790.1 chorismate synthase [Gemmatimonadota bacterium]